MKIASRCISSSTRGTYITVSNTQSRPSWWEGCRISKLDLFDNYAVKLHVRLLDICEKGSLQPLRNLLPVWIHIHPVNNSADAKSQYASHVSVLALWLPAKKLGYTTLMRVSTNWATCEHLMVCRHATARTVGDKIPGYLLLLLEEHKLMWQRITVQASLCFSDESLKPRVRQKRIQP